MSNPFDGHVFTGPRVAQSNAPTTAAPDAGVGRHVGPPTVTLPSGSPTWVEARADQYRATFEDRDLSVEYLVWAANTAHIACVEDSTWAIEDGSVSIPDNGWKVTDVGTPAGFRQDGSTRVLLTDRESRDVAGIATLSFLRGGATSPTALVLNTDYLFDRVSGVITLLNTTAMRTLFLADTAAASSARGDTFTATYYLSEARFWWTRNDSEATRFGWKESTARWEPYKGGAPIRLGVIAQGQVVNPVPVASGFVPGTSTGDGYAVLRLGAQPNATSYPIVQRSAGPFSGVLVVPEADLQESYDFTGPTPDLAGIMGASSGTILWNPAFLAAHEGEVLWVIPRSFTETSTGVVGKITDANLYLAPIPGPSERPILRIGQRKPLSVMAVETETDLAATTPTTGTVAFALSTGRLKFSTSDIERARPGTRDVPNPAFDPLFLDAPVLYDGLTLNTVAQPLKAATALVNGAGTVTAYTGAPIYVPDAWDVPGLGVSGILSVPDGFGCDPNPAITPGPRPGESGLVRRAGTCGDLILFSRKGAATKIVVVDFEDELPANPYGIPAGTAYLCLQKHSPTTGSRVMFGADLEAMFLGETVYFRQAEMVPARMAPPSVLVGTVCEPFVFAGTERLRFRLGSTDLTWTAPAGTFSAADVATSITATIGGAPGTCTASHGHIRLAGGTTVAVGFGIGGVKDLSGCRALGILPGWTSQASGNFSATDPRWAPDSGLGLGFFRSGLNLQRLNATPDIRDLYRLDETVLSAQVLGTPYQFLTQVPREDIPGYDTGVFFLLGSQRTAGGVVLARPLRAGTDVSYRFQQKQFGWLNRGSFTASVTTPVSSIDFGTAIVSGSSLLDALGGFLEVSETGGEFVPLDQGTDYVLDGNKASLTTVVGAVILSGEQGQITAMGTVLTDNAVTFTSIAAAGDRLKLITFDGDLSYRVTAVGTHTVTVTPAFPATGMVAWEVTRGVAPGTVDPSVVADVVYQEFPILSEEPFQVRVLTRLGTVGSTLANAVLAGAQVSGRNLFLRYGMEGDDLPLAMMEPTPLGPMANDSLVVPNTGAAASRFTTAGFSLQVGARVFTQGVDLLPVTSFSGDPGTHIEYLTTGGSKGLIKFGTQVLSNLEGSSVQVLPIVRAGGALDAGVMDLDPATGRLGLSTVDVLANTGETVYFVEEMIPGLDVVLNPILGAFTFTQPVRAGQLVETAYTRAVPGTGAQATEDGTVLTVREFLPVFIRREVATRVSDQVYTFNPADRSVDTTVSPQVMVDEYMASYGAPSGVNVDFDRSSLSLVDPVDDTVTVRVSYAVLEAVGGETSYTVSQPPVWRPPFYLAPDSTTFRLMGNRTAELTAGKLLRLNSFVAYVVSATFSAGFTTVVISHGSPNGAGTLAPGEDVLTLLTDRPVHPTSMTPDQQAFLPTLNAAYGLSAVPRFDPVVEGQNQLRLEGDLRRYAVAGHLIEVQGRPYVIARGELSDDGRWTLINTGTPIMGDLSWTSTLPATTFRISARPIYPEGSSTFLGAGAVLTSQRTEVVLHKGTDPGITLVANRDYTLDEGTGAITLLIQGLEPLQVLRFYRTDVRVLAPRLLNGMEVLPRIRARFAYLDPPSATNGRLGSQLLGQYTFESPDGFYLQVQPLNDYAATVAPDLTATTTPSTGPVGITPPTPRLRGRTGLEAERRELLARDRVARTYFSVYNGLITCFEQVGETLTGNAVGDRDGKIRGWVGRGRTWVPPGYEDPITGTMNPRVLWFEAWAGLRGSAAPIRLLTADPVISPAGATVDGQGRPQGAYQDPSGFNRLIEQQRKLIRNDVDDVVLTGRVRTSRTVTGFVTFSVRGFGDYRPLSSPSVFSRIFPERAGAFTTTAPGLGDPPGVYSAGRLVLNPDLSASYDSTTGDVIGRLENPVLGPIENVQGLTIRDRMARARIWSYGPAGYPSLDMGTSDRPTILATVVPLDQLPVKSDTGLPDPTRLASQSGGPTPLGTWDLTTGDPDLHTPPFKSGDAVAIGYPDGSVRSLGYSGVVLTMPDGNTRYSGVYVDQVLQGVAVTFKSRDAAGTDVQITDPQRLLVLTGVMTGTPLAAEMGQTLMVVPDTAGPITASDPPTAAELTVYARSIPTYRVGTDLNFRGRTGEILDATLPSFSDPSLFGLREITGQHPPDPLSTLEARVDFSNQSLTPLQVPAMSGVALLDSGDYSVPYMGLAGAELPILGRAAPDLGALFYADSPGGVPTPPAGVDPYSVEAVYPDEIRSSTAAIANGVMTTTADVQPGTSSYPSPGHAGTGILSPFDLLLVQVPSTVNAGSTGIQHVGAVTAVSPAQIEPPRFISPSNIGSPTTFTCLNAQTVIVPGHTAGIVVTQDSTIPGDIVTYLDLIGIPTTQVVFDNGSGGGGLATPVGGYNNLLSQCSAGSQLRISVLSSTTGNPVASADLILRVVTPGADVLATTFEVSSNNGVSYQSVLAGGLRFHAQQIEIHTASTAFAFGSYTTTVPGPNLLRTVGFLDGLFSVTVLGSTTVNIENDRLTFVLPLDCRTARPRGAVTPGGSSMETSLEVPFTGAALWSSGTSDYVSATVSSNSATNVNGGAPFTFLARAGLAPSVFGVGLFAAGIGRIKVMAWEGYNNTPITATNVVIAGMPTSRQDEEGPILAATAQSDRLWTATGPDFGANRFLPLSVLAGSVDNVQPGDTLVVKSVSENGAFGFPKASGKAGTYVVRDTMTANFTGTQHQVTQTTAAGDANGWLGCGFPTVVSYLDGVELNLTVSEIQGLKGVQDYAGTPLNVFQIFRQTGRVFLIVNEPALAATVSSAYATSVVSAAYTSIFGNTFINLTDFRDGVGSVITKAAFLAACLPGIRVSGMTLAPVVFRAPGLPPYLPAINDPSIAFFGIRRVVLTRGTSFQIFVPSTNGRLEPTIHTSLMIIRERVLVNNGLYQLPGEAVYTGVPGALDLAGVTWDEVHTTGAFTPAGTRCLLPGDVLEVQYSGKPGIYVEPSIPRVGGNLADSTPKVVDAAHALAPTSIGTPRLSSYFVDPTVQPPGGYLDERVQVEVRRPRRWHGSATDGLRDLRYAYEIRRGIVQTVTTTGLACELSAQAVDTQYLPSALVGGTATQLGDFTNPRVGIQPGDAVRFLDSQGTLFEEAEVQAVRGNKILGLSRTGLVVAPGTRFEVYLRTPLIPQEQTGEELLEQVTDKVVVQRKANYTTQQGGKVDYVTNADPQVAYDQSVNKLTDTAGAVFGSVQAGDLVVVDPAGTVAGPTGSASPVEQGHGPSGDLGVLSRGSDYTAGGPLRLDDNRGYYWVSSATSSQVVVTAEDNLLAGDRTSGDRVLGGGSTAYSIYPTVHGSNLSGSGNGLEGQMDLRPTAFAGGGNSFGSTWRSVAPFSYRVIRPRAFLSKETVELAVAIRERMLSWMEQIRSVTQVHRSGSYYVFQKEAHIADLGLGVLSNAVRDQIVGRIQVAPFSNNQTCLSVLDRRFWGGDIRLDTLHPPYGSTTPYATFASGDGRPVLPDFIQQALDQRDRLRPIRYAWLTLRTHRTTGTLERIRLFEQEIPARRAEQERALLAASSTESST